MSIVSGTHGRSGLAITALFRYFKTFQAIGVLAKKRVITYRDRSDREGSAGDGERGGGEGGEGGD